MTGVRRRRAFAIVIPTFNEAKNIERLILSIKTQSTDDYEIAVVDQGSSDGTAEIAARHGCTVTVVEKPLFYTPPAKSRNVGARSIHGRIIVHLDADMELGSPEFLATVRSQIDDHCQAAIIPEHDVAIGFWSRCKAVERICYYGTAMEAARVATRDLFEAIGGYDESVSSGEDFYITRLYAQRTQIARLESAWVNHYLTQQSFVALIRKKVNYGRTAGAYLSKAQTIGAQTGRSIVAVSLRAYLRNWHLLLEHPLEYLCILPLRAMEFLAVSLGIRLGSERRASQLP
jgi:glycosyltransferase involved in cell wall biosynthesis